MREKKDIIDKKSDRKANFCLFLGSGVVLGQFAFISTGTFQYFSWDIMEPIAYTMLYANFTCGFLFYLFKNRDL